MVLQASTCEPAQDSSRRRVVSGSGSASWASPTWFGSLEQIIHLAASTLDLEVVLQHEDIGKMKRRALDPLVHDSTAALKRFKDEETWVSDLILVQVRIAVRWSWREPLPGESCLGLEWIFLSQDWRLAVLHLTHTQEKTCCLLRVWSKHFVTADIPYMDVKINHSCR